MDEEARAIDATIFDEGMMPITVVMLMQEAASIALFLEKEYHLDTSSIFQLAIRSLKDASRRWTIADIIAMELETSRV
ncbi:hypothetical protein CEP54_007557 [Fusarium duplospermum]|uniref:Uncharacterized protein n=1 Tax=Fusarium duplospermum TaxID=1325734 RepID=A0A428Q0K6_9HYPO|nr:hypothetical protein CEP54_007557 [Fusarium duplospermum]